MARLIEPRADQSFRRNSCRPRAPLKIERRLSKAEILDLYLNIAPYGGNPPGIRAASLAWFGKEPGRLDTAGGAGRRCRRGAGKATPDRFPEAAKQARERVLQRLAVERVVGEGEAERSALAGLLPTNRRDLPAYAAHMAVAARVKFPNTAEVRSTLKLPIQRELEGVARHAAEKLPATGSPSLSSWPMRKARRQWVRRIISIRLQKPVSWR